MKRILGALGLCAALAPQPSVAETLILLGENAAGRKILIEPTSLKSLPALPNVRPFPVVQLFVVMRGPGPKDSTERVRYNFLCQSKSSAALSYYRVANGQKSHDWRGADITMKYKPVEKGGLVEMALGYACNGGKLPKPGDRTVPSQSQDETRESDGS